MQNIKAVIFDFDGTLADTIPLCITCFRQALEPIVQRSLSDDEIVAAFGPDEKGTIEKFTNEKVTEATRHFMQFYTSLHEEYVKVFDGIPDLLQQLKTKGIRLALATGKGKEACRYSLEKLSLVPYFEIIETGSPKGSRKKEAIRQILQSFQGVTKEETIYVGDSSGDVKESRESGIRPVAVAWATTAKKSRPGKGKAGAVVRYRFFVCGVGFQTYLISHFIIPVHLTGSCLLKLLFKFTQGFCVSYDWLHRENRAERR